MPEIVLSFVILMHANSMTATPSRRAEPGLQVITVCVSVTEFQNLQKHGKEDLRLVLERMAKDNVFLGQIKSKTVGLNYASQIVGGGGYLEGPGSDEIGVAAAIICKVRVSE